MSDLPDDADEAATETVLDIVAIKKIIPHRYPLLLVDRIIEMVPGERVVGLKSVTGNEPFFEGHFPDYPVMPGVLIIEALAQTGAVMMLQESEVQTREAPCNTAQEQATAKIIPKPAWK